MSRLSSMGMYVTSSFPVSCTEYRNTTISIQICCRQLFTIPTFFDVLMLNPLPPPSWSSSSCSSGHHTLLAFLDRFCDASSPLLILSTPFGPPWFMDAKSPSSSLRTARSAVDRPAPSPPPPLAPQPLPSSQTTCALLPLHLPPPSQQGNHPRGRQSSIGLRRSPPMKRTPAAVTAPPILHHPRNYALLPHPGEKSILPMRPCP